MSIRVLLLCLIQFFFFLLVFSELTVPTVVVLNTSNQQYFLLDRHIKDASDMVQFINSILDGTVPVSNWHSFQRDEEKEAEDKLADFYLWSWKKNSYSLPGGKRESTSPTAFSCLIHSVSYSSVAEAHRYKCPSKSDLEYLCLSWWWEKCSWALGLD